MQPVLSVVEASHISRFTNFIPLYCGDNKLYRCMPVSAGSSGKRFCVGKLEPSDLLLRYMISCRVPGSPFFNPGCLLEFTWCDDVGIGVVRC